MGEKSRRMELVTQYSSLCLDTAICQQLLDTAVCQQLHDTAICQQLLLKPRVHTGSRWMSLVNQTQTRLQDASCQSSHQTRGKFRGRKRQSTNLRIPAPFARSPKRTPLQSNCCRTFRCCVRYRPHVTRSTYLSLYRTALAFRLAQFDITLQSQIHHVRELERLCTQIALIIITSNTLPELHLFKLQMTENKYSGKCVNLTRMP